MLRSPVVLFRQIKFTSSLWIRSYTTGLANVGLVNRSLLKGENVARACQTSFHLQSKWLADSPESPSMSGHKPSNFDKKILLWNKCYPSIEDVPERVSYSQMHKAKDWFRIRVNIAMMIATVILSIGYISSGRIALREGDSITKQVLKRNTKLREDHLAEQEKKSI